MSEYQVYSIDAQGRISDYRLIQAATDDEAIFAAQSMKRQLKTEVWRGDRRVGRVAAVPRIAP